MLLLAPERAREHSAQQVLAPDLDLQVVEEVHGLVLEETSARQTARALEILVGEDPTSGHLVVVVSQEEEDVHHGRRPSEDCTSRHGCR